jgi:hypothetical protein
MNYAKGAQDVLAYRADGVSHRLRRLTQMEFDWLSRGGELGGWFRPVFDEVAGPFAAGGGGAIGGEVAGDFLPRGYELREGRARRVGLPPMGLATDYTD